MTRLRLSNASGRRRSVIAKLKKELYRRVLKSADEVRRLLVMRFIAPSHIAHAAWKPADYNGRVFQESESLQSVPLETVGRTKEEIDCEGTCGLSWTHKDQKGRLLKHMHCSHKAVIIKVFRKVLYCQAPRCRLSDLKRSLSTRHQYISADSDDLHVLFSEYTVSALGWGFHCWSETLGNLGMHELEHQKINFTNVSNVSAKTLFCSEYTTSIVGRPRRRCR
jgi:hypothetical protein